MVLLGIVWCALGALAWGIKVKCDGQITVEDLLMLVPCTAFGGIAFAMVCFSYQIVDKVLWKFK